MARIRSIKPEFFIDEDLQDLEASNLGAYCMLVFAGLWAIADREGRFEWRPRKLRLSILPYIDFDLSNTMDVLLEHGYLIRYEVEEKQYGAIKNWSRHQIVSRDEPPSEIPSSDGLITPYFRPLTQSQRINIYNTDNYTCQYCGKNLRDNQRAICLDHVIPYSKGGTNRPGNLTTSCKRCNAVKSDKTPAEAGLTWPSNKGERIVDGILTSETPPVNGTSTGSQQVPDKEREREREREREKEINQQQQQAGACEQLAVVFVEKQDRLKELFPDINLNVALEKFLNRCRGKPCLLDPYEATIKWLQSEFKPVKGEAHGAGNSSRTRAAVGKAPGIIPPNGPEADWLDGSTFTTQGVSAG